jgi:chaperonin GroEL (HSP60 family)
MDDLISGATILSAIDALRKEQREDMRELRESFEAFRVECAGKVAVLEAKMTTVLGNGQPGRLTVVEEKIGDLQRVHWKQAGIASTLGFVGAFVLEVVRKKLGF